MKSLITEPLGLFGWKHLEPVLLAALSTKMPLLLVGKHGCAKSFVLEKLAKSLKLKYRFYNASLINYDDLVGIPIPDEDNKSLKYITNDTSIWDAEVVFVDEINRTKPELQNKLFPIIYDKRIQGKELENLQYRWAAMNPPTNEDDDIDYLGAMPLDPALADRFPFIVIVPSWNDLSAEDTKNMLIDQYLGEHDFVVDIEELIKKTEETYKRMIVELQDDSIKYIQTLMNIISNSIGYISPRRATMLQATLLSIHAARIVLNEYCDEQEEIKFEDSCYIAIEHCLPSNASMPLDKAKLYALASQAYKISMLSDCPEKKMLLLQNNEDKFVYMVKNQKKINPITLSETILSNLSSFEEKKRRAVALIGYLAFRCNSEVLATTIETLAEESKKCFIPISEKRFEHIKKARYAETIAELSQENKDQSLLEHRNNLLNSFMPDGFNSEDEIKELANFFAHLWERIYA